MRRQNGISLLAILLMVAVVVSAAVWWKREQTAKQRVIAATERALQDEQRISKERKAAEAELLAEQQALAAKARQTEQLKIETENAIAALAAVTTKFNDGVKLAKSTARIALSSPVAALQNIMRETESVAATPCTAMPKRKLVEGMNKYIDAFMLFMSDPKLGEFKAILKMDEGARLIADVDSELSVCKRFPN